MNQIQTVKQLFFLSILCMGIVACGDDNGKDGTDESSIDGPKTSNTQSKKVGNAEVIIWELSDPDKLNPYTYSSANSYYIVENIFSSLLDYGPSADNPNELNLRPRLAATLPTVEELTEGEYAGGMALTYEIRPEAVWDNGEPITAADVVFTIKTIKNPKVNSGPIRPYYQFVHDVKVDEANPKKFTVYSKDRYFLAEAVSGQTTILPEYVYDPNQIMRGFTIPQLSDPKQASKLVDDPKLMEFATEYNSSKFERETVVGSGPYKFMGWESNKSITLELKKDWWGSKVSGASALEAYPPKIVYTIVSDMNTAVTALKDEGLDVMRGMKPDAYMELKENRNFGKMYNLSTPDQFAYYYLGFNMKNPKLADKRVRRAFAHLIDVDEIIETLYYGMATPTKSPINPNKDYYNNDLPELSFDPEAATKLLAEAGWKDTDGDGILDKTINGKKESLKIKYKYNQGNLVRKSIGLLLKDNAKRVGIDIEVIAKEWTVFLEDAKKRDFEIVCLAWVQGPELDDLKQIWHRESDTPDGSNRVGFGNAKSDQIIDQIRVTLDPAKRKELYMEIQQIIHDEQPYVFLFVPKERIAIHRRFGDVKTNSLRPGYAAKTFKLRSAEQ
ncbi:MAG: ABC transporter substrate-binding protein [Saprospiraceae bacterium]|nr:ABC transporter substrate-binding protein [Saprospiraceae bacterium]